MRCLCRSSKEFFFVSRSSCILTVNSCCCWEESPLMTWCTSQFLYSHCLCVMDFKLDESSTPQLHWAPWNVSAKHWFYSSIYQDLRYSPLDKTIPPKVVDRWGNVIVRRVQGDEFHHRATALSKKISLYVIWQILIGICLAKYIHDAFNWFTELH